MVAELFACTVGFASWYGHPFHGQTTASGDTFNKYEMTAAHKTLPFGTRLKVTNPENNQSVVITINDRGPFTAGRDLDLSKAAMKKLGGIQHGVIKVEYCKIKGS
jgi:rare lipoprotein A